MKRIVSLTLFFILLFAPNVYARAQSAVFLIGKLNYIKDDKTITMDVAPYISQERAYVSLRYFADALDIAKQDLLWDETSKKVTFRISKKQIELFVGSNKMMIDGKEEAIEAAPEILNDRVMIPLLILKKMGYFVAWDQATQTIALYF
ncbi:hypothetical protein GTO91_13860 [Heliobacterium undosum]|uniref:Copper amine oxidase-like N-terminal domain-containing protein n=1 Tax=Heliomicrobium undosum TaxID=121734 RepID=A0A845L6C8_9FIRM|nr:copper amine oxidase N-terminal domain-containing protein [Heliomicrobium undosum]MZP30799.1 hypothetical protein [Heliomicrobium undosum]